MISPGTWPHCIRCSRASGNGGAEQSGPDKGGSRGVLTCGYSCTALREITLNYGEWPREKEIGKCDTFFAGRLHRRQKEKLERKKNVNAFSFLYSFFHFSSSLLPLLQDTLSRYTFVVLARAHFLPSLRFLIPALLCPSIFIILTSLTSVSFFFFFHSWVVLLIFLLLEALLLIHARTLFDPLFLFVTSLCIFSYPFCVSLVQFLSFKFLLIITITKFC